MSDEAESSGSSLEGLSDNTPREQPSEIQVTIGAHSKFIADNFDKLYDEVELLKDNLEAMEIRLWMEMDKKMKDMQELLMARIELLDGQTTEQSDKIAKQRGLSKQQGTHLEDIQRQVGVLFFRF